MFESTDTLRADLDTHQKTLLSRRGILILALAFTLSATAWLSNVPIFFYLAVTLIALLSYIYMHYRASQPMLDDSHLTSVTQTDLLRIRMAHHGQLTTLNMLILLVAAIGFVELFFILHH